MNVKGEELVRLLEQEADAYLKECTEHKTEKLANTGKVEKVMDRHIPTIDYFLNIHLQILHKDDPDYNTPKISRTTFYEWLNLDPEDYDDPEKKALAKLKTNTIKRIDRKFKALATDIVANEGKGIFYAKNRLGMTDKIQQDGQQKVTHTIISLGSGVKPPEAEPERVEKKAPKKRVVLKKGVTLKKK